jgi:hypothetical protein
VLTKVESQLLMLKKTPLPVSVLEVNEEEGNTPLGGAAKEVTDSDFFNIALKAHPVPLVNHDSQQHQQIEEVKAVSHQSRKQPRQASIPFSQTLQNSQENELKRQ